MNRRPHDDRDDMKVWLSADEVATLLDAADDTMREIAFALGARCGLRAAEIVSVRPVDVVETGAGDVVRVRESGAKNDKYRETPLPPGLRTQIETLDDVRDADSDAPIVDTTTRTLRRWIDDVGHTLADETGDTGWSDVSMHDLRRTWATLLAGEGVDPLVVIDWGGWSDLETFLDHYRGTYSPEVQRREREGVEWLS